MARFKPAMNIWLLTSEERKALQPGQWVYAGDKDHKGRFYGSGEYVDVVAWLGNARRKGKRGYADYMAFMADYGRSKRAA